MPDNPIELQLQEIFREVFLDDELELSEELTAEDVDRWDSITHYDMIAMTEERFGITLTTREVATLQNVGDLLSLIRSKVSG